VSAPAPRAFVHVLDARLREAFERALQATGYAIDRLDLARWEALPDGALLAIGTGSIPDALAAALAQLTPRPALMLVAESGNRAREIAAFLAHQADHLVDASSPTLLATLRKLAPRDHFGIARYLQDGAAVTRFAVATPDERRDVLDEVAELAARERCHPLMAERLGTALDEMIINALYRPDPVVLAGARPIRPAAVELGCDGRFLAVGVSDTYGRFAHVDLFQALDRAREYANSGVSATTTHASLGIHTMLEGLAHLAIDVAPGRSTEVIGLVDLSRSFKASRTAVPGISWFETIT
jgi:hypothetical protein